MTRIAKLLRLVPRLAYALVAGACVRYARRALRLPPRIWHGFIPSWITAMFVACDRRAGFPSRSVARHTRLLTYALVRREEFDAVYEDGGARWDEAHWLCLADLLRHGDLWVTYFENLFLRHDQAKGNRFVMRLIRAAGIRIIVLPHGGDILHRSEHRSRYDWIGRAQLDYPQWDLAAQKEIVDERVAIFTKYASLVFGGDHTLTPLLPRYDLVFCSLAMDTAALQPEPADAVPRPVPRIIHAPNHRHAKGTELLTAAVETLQARGFACELVLIEKLARQEALSMYRTADIIADQFIIGSFGVFACEGMTLGKPVLTYLSEATLRDPRFSMPVVNATPENLMEVLAALLRSAELRRRIGIASRAAIERYQSIEALTPVWKQLHEHVWWGRALHLEETAVFGAERRPRAETEDPREEAFWPVDVSDRIAEIRAAIHDARR